MTLINDYHPLISGPWGRALSIWIEIVVFALSLLSGYGIMSFITFGVTFFALIFDITLCIKRHRRRKQQESTSEPPPYVQNSAQYSPATSTTFRPRKAVIAFDFVFGVIYLVTWIMILLFGGGLYGDYRYDTRGYGYRGYYNYSTFGIFPAFTNVGVLALAQVDHLYHVLTDHLRHVHIFFGACETDILRKLQKTGKGSATAPMPSGAGIDEVELEAGNAAKP